MISLTFTVPFVKGKARPRFSNGRAYSPRATREAEAQIKAAYIKASEDRFGCVITAHESVPVDVFVFTNRNVLSSFRKRDGDTHPDTQKPDADNIAKLVLDALNGIAYVDDSQVREMLVIKCNRVRGALPETKIRIEWEDTGFGYLSGTYAGS